MQIQDKLNHRRAEKFIEEFADRFTLTGMQSGNGLAIALTLGRDSLEIKYENLMPDGAGGMTSSMDEKCLDPYRLDLATFQMPLHAAKSLAEGLLNLVENAPGNTKVDAKDANPV